MCNGDVLPLCKANFKGDNASDYDFVKLGLLFLIINNIKTCFIFLIYLCKNKPEPLPPKKRERENSNIYPPGYDNKVHLEVRLLIWMFGGVWKHVLIPVAVLSH